MKFSSPAFSEGGTIPLRHTGEGEDISPPLAWSGLPENTASVALIVDDPDAPPGVWVHWVIYDLPARLSGLKEGVPKMESLPDGSKQGRCWGVDRFERVGYYGPYPPPGKAHRYVFKIFALKKKLELKAKASKDEVLKAMRGSVLDQAELTGLYKR